MMRRSAFLVVLALVGFNALPAQADPVRIDPIIGVRGGEDFGSPPLFPGATGALTACEGFENFGSFNDLGDYNCLVLEIPEGFDGSITSLTIRFFSDGSPIFNDDFFLSDEVDDIDTGFEVLEKIGAFGLRLSNDFEGPPSPLLGCGELGSSSCGAGDDVLFYFRAVGNEVFGDLSLTVDEINDVGVIPEPGTILLLGTGLAGLAGRRLRRRQNA
jgi:hypothetical protein